MAISAFAVGAARRAVSAGMPATPVAPSAAAIRLAQASFVALIAFLVLWEAWLAPLRPGGSWMVLKALPLLVLAPRILRAEPRAFQWAVLLMLLYLGEGAARVFEPLPWRACAVVELVLAIVFFAAAVRVLRPYKRARSARKEPDR